jgi:hypothetical protein
MVGGDSYDDFESIVTIIKLPRQMSLAFAFAVRADLTDSLEMPLNLRRGPHFRYNGGLK